MSSKPFVIIMDGDMVVFRACSSVEKPIQWENDLWTLHADAAEAKEMVDEVVCQYVDRIMEHYGWGGEYQIVMCFTDPTGNFRKKIMPTYKANRAGKLKPVCFGAVMQWVMDNYDAVMLPNLEADDCVGILSTCFKKEGREVCVVSGDKDFKTIPTRFYDFIHDEFYEIDEATADRNHLAQTLIGDIADNYKGCPKIGAVGAKKILDADCSWKAVATAFEKAGLPEEEALANARVAYILRDGDYDFLTGEVKLWTPRV